MNLSPLNRNNKYFSEKEYQYYVEQGREYLKTIDTSFLFIKVIKEQSQIDDLYGEAYNEEITYAEPIQIPAVIELTEGENKAYVESKGMIRYEEYGNLLCHVLLADLELYGADITYGDFLGYRVSETEVIYFEVGDDNQKAEENNKVFLGYRKFWKTIVGVPTSQTFDI